MCGVGVYFTTEGENAKPIIRGITDRGSAYREGTIAVGDSISHIDGASVIGWTMMSLRHAIVGHAGTIVRLTINKPNGRMFEIPLTRGTPEYWYQVDQNENLRKDVRVRDKEIEALRRKLLETESAMTRDRSEMDNLAVQVGSLERLNAKLRIDMDRESDMRRLAESSVASLTADKNGMEDQVEGMIKKLSESSLSFKSAQGLAREMTEKARQSEQARVMEEKLRKMAEAREAKSQALLLEEVQRRKEAEADRTVSEAKVVELGENVRRMETLTKELAKIKGEVLELQGQVTIAHSEIESKKDFISKVQKENAEVRSQAGDAEIRVLAAKKEVRDALDRVKMMENAMKSAIESKDEALVREAEQTNALTKTDGVFRSTQMKLTDSEAVCTALRGEVQKMQVQLANTVSEKGKAVLQLSDAEKSLSAFKDKYESLLVKQRGHEQMAEASMSSLRLEIAELNKSVAAREQRVSDLQTQLASTTRELNAKITGVQGDLRLREDKLESVTHQLTATQVELKNTKALLTEHERKEGEAVAHFEAAQSEVRVLTAEISGLKQSNGQLAEEINQQHKVVNELTGQVLREKQAKEAIQGAEDEIAKRCGELQGELLECQAKLRQAEAHAENFETRRSDLEAKIKAGELVKMELQSAMAAKREAESMAESYEVENKRLAAVEIKLRQDLLEARSEISTASSKVAHEKMDLLQKYSLAERELREAAFDIQNERDNLQAELNRFMSLPNPCGIGLSLEEIIEKLPTGGTIKTIRVAGMQPGLSADQSGKVLVGDSIIEVDGMSVNGMTMEETRAKLSGKRGSRITVKFMRDLTDDGEANGDTYTITLKRGAFGPEHAVLAPEDKDMRDVGRWPRAGAVSDAEMGTYERAAIENRTSRIK